MKKIISLLVVLTMIVLYTNITYALINNYISLDSDGYEISGNNDNIVLKDKYKENTSISIVVKQNPYGAIEITDDILLNSLKEIEKKYGVSAIMISKNAKTSIGKDNKYYKCGRMMYSLKFSNELILFVSQYIIPTDNYIYAITICTQDKEYLTDSNIMNLLNSITLQDTITNNNYNENVEKSNTTLIEDSIKSGIDGAIESAILAGFALIIGLIARKIVKTKKDKKENTEEKRTIM